MASTRRLWPDPKARTVAMNLRIRDLIEGDVIELGDASARVSCALVLEDDAIIVLDDEHGRQWTVTGPLDVVRLISRGAPKVA